MWNNLFARSCRVLGRFLLSAGAICLAGAVTLVASPLLIDSDTQAPSVTHRPAETVVNPSHVQTFDFSNNLPSIIISIVCVAFILVVTILVMRRYNDDIRKIIKNIANLIHLSIQVTELALVVFVWSIVVLLTIFNAPLFSILALFALIINELFFIFAWTSYGCKNYTA